MAKKTKKVEEINLDEVESKEVKTVEGLGDVIASVTDFLGITKCEDCEERRKKLNKMFPFTKVGKEIPEEDREFVENLKDKGKLKNEDAHKIIELMYKVFNMKVKFCNCPAVFKQYIEKLKIQLEYNDIK